MCRVACFAAGAAAGGIATGAVACGAAVAGGELGLGVVVVCANAPTGIASAATTIAVVTEFFSVMVMSSRLPEQRHPLQDARRTKCPPSLFACLNNSFVLPQS